MTALIAGRSFAGRLVLPEHPDFDEARIGRVFNGRRPDRQPAAVLIAETVQDVVDGVLFARENGLSVAVRSGGHSWAAWSVREGTLLIDLGLLRDIEYNETTGIVSAEPAVTGGEELDPLLEPYGRFFNGGHCPTVGIGGFLLQGGQGWCARGWGWAAESVVGLDVVTADGQLIRVDAEHHADLYWAARGSGPSFPAVVVRFHIQTRPRFGYLGHTVQVFPITLFSEVMTWIYGMHGTVSPDVELVVVSMTPEAAVPGGERERVVLVTAVALVDTKEEADDALAPFADNPLLDRAIFSQNAAESTLAAQRAEQVRMNPEHARYVVDNVWVDGDVADVVEGIRPLFTELPTPEAFSIWFSMGPLRELPDMAFSLQSEGYVASYMVYNDPAQDEAHRTWLNAAMAHAQPVTVGQYLGDSDMTNRQLRVMGDEQYARLQRIIAERDPEGRFARYLARDHSTVNRNHWQIEGAL
ncbi:FAD-binding oxidoreductase [Okibacterium endophyticum]